MRKIGVLFFLGLFSLTAFAEEVVPSEDDMLREAAKEYREQSRLRREMDNQAEFEEQFDFTFPVTPDQVRSIRKRQRDLDEAMQIPVPENGVTRSVAVSLKPGSKAPVLRLYPQYVTTVRILDSHGNPWPIRAYMVGSQKGFQVQKPDMEPYDTLMVSPLVSVGSTNLTLMLDNRDGSDPVPPLSLQLIVNPDFGSTYDSVTSLRMDRAGPLSKSPVPGDSEEFFVDDAMLAFLDGTPPARALPMKSSDKDIQAWSMNGRLYLRSSRQIIWPAWTKSVTSGERRYPVYAYELPPVSSVMLSGHTLVTLEPYPDAINRILSGETK